MPTGIAIALPDGYVALVHPRSGLAARFGVSIVNAPGTVDAGYRGEIKVLLVNLDPREPVDLARGDRIAQLVVQQVEKAALRRGGATSPGRPAATGGYGSTGGFARDSGRRPPRRCTDVPTQEVRRDPGRRRPTTPEDDAPAGPRRERPLGRLRGRPSTRTTPTGSTSAACWSRPRAGLELQLQVDEASGQVVAVVLAGEDGAVELRAFAAPRTAASGTTSAARSPPRSPGWAARPPSPRAPGAPRCV